MSIVRHVLRAGSWVTFQSLSLNREGRLSVLVSLDDRRLREPLLLLSVYDRVPVQP